MTRVQPLRRDDLAEVADLYKGVFLTDRETDLDDLRSYFETVYFDHPYYDEDCPSLIYPSTDGDIAAFMGITSAPMRFRGEKIKAAVMGNLMVKGARFTSDPNDQAQIPSYGYRMAPAAIGKYLMKAPYDLVLTDTAVEISRRIWERIGGSTMRLYSLRWLRLLRPVSLGLSVLARRDKLRPFIRPVRPVGTLLDRTARSLVAPETAALPKDCVIGELQPEEMVERLAADTSYDLVPDHSLDGLSWILQMVRSRKRFGELRSIAIRNTGGHLLGWALYDGVPSDIGRVLQLYADPKHTHQVLQCLFYDAAQNGLSALGGKADPMFFQALSDQMAIIRASAWMVVRAHRPELLQAFHEGKVLFSDLESEGWTRFMGAHNKREFAPD